MDNIEKIGNVVLNFSFYKGNDLYSDGENVENELLEIVKNYSQEKFNEIIYDRRKWPLLYHLSEIRTNVLEWIPIEKSETVLEIGSGCGAITSILYEKAKKVTCVELSKKRSTINAYRNIDKDNIEILIGNFQDIEITEKYDYITLIGVFEYAASYINSKNPYEEFLNIIKKYLKPNGKIIMAIENKLGLKYWSGCKEDHTGRYFEGLEGYQNTDIVKTFSKKELEKLLKKTGFKDNEFYYPYPDYKLPNIIYSDEYLPKLGELNNNFRNFDEDRMILFNETEVFNSIIEAELFPEMSNSFIVVSSSNKIEKDRIIFSKYSDSRDNKFKIRTSIIKKAKGTKIVEKVALNDKAIQHLEKIYNNYNLLKNKYNSTSFNLLECRKCNKNIEFDFLEGKTFVEILNEELSKNGLNGIVDKLIKIKEKLYKIKDEKNFSISRDFIEIFGNIDFKEELEGITPANIDFIGSNLIVDKENQNFFNIIDYEWVFNFSVPINYIIYRMVLYYGNENTNPKIFNLEKILEKLDIKKIEIEKYDKMNKSFTNYVLQNEYFLYDLYFKFNINNLDIEELLKLKEESDKKNSIQIFENIGFGYSEENSYKIKKEKDQDGNINIDVFLENNLKSLRIDVTEEKCIVFIKDKTKGLKLYTNGEEIYEDVFLFKNPDPQLLIDELPKGLAKINLKIEIFNEKSFFKEIINNLKIKNKEIEIQNKNIEEIKEIYQEEILNKNKEIQEKTMILENILNSKSFKLIKLVKKIIFWRK